MTDPGDRMGLGVETPISPNTERAHLDQWSRPAVPRVADWALDMEVVRSSSQAGKDCASDCLRSPWTLQASDGEGPARAAGA